MYKSPKAQKYIPPPGIPLCQSNIAVRPNPKTTPSLSPSPSPPLPDFDSQLYVTNFSGSRLYYSCATSRTRGDIKRTLTTSTFENPFEVNFYSPDSTSDSCIDRDWPTPVTSPNLASIGKIIASQSCAALAVRPAHLKCSGNFDLDLEQVQLKLLLAILGGLFY